jgi:hypothetical protein
MRERVAGFKPPGQRTVPHGQGRKGLTGAAEQEGSEQAGRREQSRKAGGRAGAA